MEYNPNPSPYADRNPVEARTRSSGVRVNTARATMLEAGFNPIVEALKRFNDPTLSERTHNEMLRELLARWSPTLKSVEITDNSLPKGNVIIQIQSVPSPEPDGPPTITAATVTHTLEETNNLQYLSTVVDTVEDDDDLQSEVASQELD